jgi:hypothetical protein
MRFDDIKDEIAEAFYIPISSGAEFVSFDFLILLMFDLWLISLYNRPYI